MLGLKEDGYWSEEDKQAAGGLSEVNAWEAYQRGLLRKRNTQVNNKVLTEGDIKSMERVLGLKEDGIWSAEDQKAAKGFSAATAWEAYQSGALQRWKSKGLFEQGLSNGSGKEKKVPEKTAKATQFQVIGADERAALEKKYSGMTYSELRNAINNLEDGSEKDWVITNVLALTTQLDYTKALQRTKGDLGMAIALKDEDQKLKKRLQVIEPGSEEAKKIIARRAEIYRQFGNLDDYIERLREDVWWLERDAKYKFINQNQDFAELSKKDPPFMDWTYVAVNNPTKARRWETAAFIHGLAPVYDALNYDNLQQMEDDERAIFNYLYAKEGKKAAREYLEYLEYTLNERSMNDAMQWVSNRTQDVPILSQTIASQLSTPIALLGGTGLVDAAEQRIRNTVTGNDKPIDYNRDAMFATKTSSHIRDAVSKQIVDVTGTIELDPEQYPKLSKILNGKSWADIYEWGMGVQDSAAVVALSAINPALGEVGTILLSGSTATQALLDAVERGATDDQALAIGMVSGGIEVLFEKIELDNLLKIDSKNLQKFCDKTLIGAFGGSAKELSNFVADCLIMAKNSNYQRNVENYLKENPTWSNDQAEKQALIDAALQIAGAGFEEATHSIVLPPKKKKGDKSL